MAETKTPKAKTKQANKQNKKPNIKAKFSSSRKKLYVPVVALDHHRHFHATESHLHTYFRVFGRGGRGRGGKGDGEEEEEEEQEEEEERAGRRGGKKKFLRTSIPNQSRSEDHFLNNKQNKQNDCFTKILLQRPWKLLRFCFSSSEDGGKNSFLTAKAEFQNL
jgi:hypothetical protein